MGQHKLVRTVRDYNGKGAPASMISTSKFKMTVCLAVAGASLLGCFKCIGTLLLGHMRPAWMEFEFAPRYALYGLATGGVLGLAVDVARELKRRRT